jgi:hypothetical protein
MQAHHVLVILFCQTHEQFAAQSTAALHLQRHARVVRVTWCVRSHTMPVLARAHTCGRLAMTLTCAGLIHTQISSGVQGLRQRPLLQVL